MFVLHFCIILVISCKPCSLKKHYQLWRKALEGCLMEKFDVMDLEVVLSQAHVWRLQFKGKSSETWYLSLGARRGYSIENQNVPIRITQPNEHFPIRRDNATKRYACRIFWRDIISNKFDERCWIPLRIGHLFWFWCFLILKNNLSILVWDFSIMRIGTLGRVCLLLKDNTSACWTMLLKRDFQ